MVCPANSSYSFRATALIFCKMFIHIMEVCMSTGFWFSSNILEMTGSWTYMVCPAISSYSFNILWDVYTHNRGVHVHRILMVRRGHHLCLTDTSLIVITIVTTERLSSVRPLTFHILINSSEAIGPIWTKLWWNGPWMAPFQNCVRWSRLPTKMVAKLKIEKRGDEILIVHCCFSISQNELKF